MAYSPPGGGSVFATGSIATAAALLTDPHAAPPFSGPDSVVLTKMFRNALHQMGVVSRVTLSVVTSGGRLYTCTFNGTVFGGWVDLGGGFSTAPTGLMWSPNILGLMAINGGHFYNYFYNGTAWSSVSDMGFTFLGRPAAVAWGRSRLSVFARGTDGNIYERRADGGTWIDASFRSMGQGISDIAAIVQEGRRISLASLSSSLRVVHYQYCANDSPSGNWTSQDVSLPGLSYGIFAPTLLAWGGNCISLFVIDNNHQLWMRTWDGANWLPSPTGWMPIGGSLQVYSRVAAATFGSNQFTIFAVDSANRIVCNFWDGRANDGLGQWNGWTDFGLTVAAGSEPAATSFRGESILVSAVSSTGLLMIRTWDGSSWSDWTSTVDAGNVFLTSSPSLFSWYHS